ncbi:MAG: hypothetical protein HOO96_19255 [Polyangiaceae bacterium]|nr:hypothetical protein [Polyangiaceae bacterium]
MKRLTCLALLACGSTGPSADDAGATAAAPTLQLVSEKRFDKLLPAAGDLEASGLTVVQGKLWVVMDNSRAVAQVGADLGSATLGPGAAGASQYEGVTTSSDGRIFAVRELESDVDRRSKIVELGIDGAPIDEAFADRVFPSRQGFEGLAALPSASGDPTLLALCQGNECDDAPKDVGKGRIDVLRRSGAGWVTIRTLELPRAVAFASYSDLALRTRSDERLDVAVVSRGSRALWLGVLDATTVTFVGTGAIYTFPERYCALEGVTFLSASTFAFASDADSGCKSTEQSLHVFALAAGS